MNNYMTNSINSKDRLYHNLTSSTGITITTYKNNEDTLFENSQNTNGYFYSLPDSIKIFQNIESQLDKIPNSTVRLSVGDFIYTFQKLLRDMVIKKRLSNYLPNMMVEINDDSSVFFEWIFKDFRIGFSIELNVNESSWYLITNKNLEELSVSGSLYAGELSLVITKIIKYVLENT